jgi:GNAT superfamily N-acetyltransferase
MIAIRLMTAADIPLGMHLKSQAGWNQTEADWRRLLALDPEGCFVAELDGRAVGTTATTLFGPVGWISMVLVEASVRRLGIGTRLLEHALAYLDRAGAKTVRLDATPLGRPVYEKLGFIADYELARWEGAASRAAPSFVITSEEGFRSAQRQGEVAVEVSPLGPGELQRLWASSTGKGQPPVRLPSPQSPPDAGEELPAAPELLTGACALDFEVTGTHRRRLIERLYQERSGAFRAHGGSSDVLAYGAWRYGSHATQIGPLVSRNETAGRALAEAVLARLAGQPILVDIPAPNAPAVAWATSHGLTVQRPFLRMHRGPPVLDEPKQIWASFGPEKG